MEWAIAHNLIIRFFEAFVSRHILVVKEHQILLHLLSAKWYTFQPQTWYIIQSVLTSVEWLVEKLKNNTKYAYTISMWIPLGAILFDEFTEINSNLQDTVINNSIILENNALPQIPLASTINIVVAHGNDAITSFPAFFYKDEGKPTVSSELNEIIGIGKVLILFVCYGGLTKMDSFRSQVSSLTTRYLREGYDAVIAPFWSLSTAIPQIWLPEFFDKLKCGVEISKAVWSANNAVREKFDSPNAYACMHLYGNPFFQIES